MTWSSTTSSSRWTTISAVTPPRRSRDERNRGGSPVSGVSATIPVELGDRSYDIIIGRDIIDTAPAPRSPGGCPDARLAIVTDATVADLHLTTLVAQPRRGRNPPCPRSSSSPARRRRASRRWRPSSTVCSRRGWNAATRSLAFGGGVVGDLAGFAVGHRAARHPPDPDADDTARPGRLLGRRQDRHQHRARQEPRRRLSSARSRPRRCRHPRFAAAAHLQRRLCRGREIRADPRSRLLRLARDQLAGGRRRLAGARARHRGRLPGQGRHRLRGRARAGQRAPCSISATPSAMRSRR